MKTLETTFLGITFPNPLILPSGIIQEIKDHKRAITMGAGGITLKSITVEPRPGYPLPRMWKYEPGYINAVGIRNPGLEKGILQIKTFTEESSVPVIVSIFAASITDFRKLGQAVKAMHPSLVEINLSCPHTRNELGQALSMGAKSTFQAVHTVREEVGKKIKVLAKLSPNIQNIGEIAKVAESAGADGISAINTVGPGMIIDIQRKKPVLGNQEGGVSGAGIKPIAIRCVYDIYNSVKIPIIGMGGISAWQDAVEMMMAGATLVGVGSAVYLNKNVYNDIKKGLIEYMKKEKLKSLKEIVGVAHN